MTRRTVMMLGALGFAFFAFEYESTLAALGAIVLFMEAVWD